MQPSARALAQRVTVPTFNSKRVKNKEEGGKEREEGKEEERKGVGENIML